MSIFNYSTPSPYFNPAGDIEKITNELPASKKAKTKSHKKAEETEEKAKPEKKKRIRRIRKTTKTEE